MRLFLLCVLTLFAYHPSSLADQPAPKDLPYVTPAMRSAGFWISRHPSVDQTVMTEAQIKLFNQQVRSELKLTKDIFTLVSGLQTESLLDTLKKHLSDHADRGYYLADGTQQDQAFIDRVRKNMHLSGLMLGQMPRYGIMAAFADQRFLPTAQGLFSKRGDTEFDELQNSALDAGTPVAVVHTSLDGKWSYVISTLSDGWVETKAIAFAQMKQVKDYADKDHFAVIVAYKADIFLDEAMTQHYQTSRMGNRFVLLEEHPLYWVVEIPSRNKDGSLALVKGYLAREHAHRGYLPYTARTIYNQAFRMLDKPYGWGDMNAEQDCSRLLQMIYATVGIELPRDSVNQAKTGTLVAAFDDKTPGNIKMAHLEQATGASTILYLKGHIMIFLGMVDGRPYAIHATSGYMKTIDEKQVKMIINKTVVSDLSLGEHSARGSLLRRLLKIVGVRHDEH